MAERTVKAVLKADCSQFVASFRQADKATRDFTKNATDSAGKNKAAWESTGKGMMVSGAVIAAGVGLAVKAFMDFDASMSQVQAGTMASGQSLDALREAAIDAGAKTQYSATEAADAITAMGKAGVSTKDILGGGLTGALSLAAAGQLDVGEASEIAATAMNQFGLEGKDIPHIADLLAAGAGKAMGSVSDLAGALKFAGPTAKGLGVSIEETTGTLAMFAQQGIKGEQAGTNLRGVLLTLTSPSGIVAKRMEDLGLNMYDANGEFIGMKGAAGELQAKLGPLDNATRNAALGQIFGNEQVGAARILYEGGAGAVDKWTKNVNDAGFAARQAAMLTDNLKGDVERLGGSLSSVLIQSGSGANGMLREMTQQLQGAVDLYGSMPVPVQQGATALGALAAAALLAGGGLITLAPRIVATKAALENMGRTGQLLSSGLGKAATAGRMLGGPLVLGAVLLGAFANQAQESRARVDELAASLDQQTGALTENTAATANKILSDSGMLVLGKSMGIAAGDVTNAYLGNADALTRVNAAMADYEAQGTTMGDQQSANSDEADKLRNAIGGGNTELNEATEKTRLLAEANAAAIDPTTGLTGAEKDAAIAAKALTASDEDLAKAAADLKKEHDELTASITSFGSAMMAARGDARSYEAAIDAAAEAVKTNGKTLDITTEKGRNNQAALDGISTSALKQAESTLTAAEANGTLGKASKTVGKDVADARKAFIDSAVSMGMNKRAAGALATQAGLTSGRVQGITDELIRLGKENPTPTVTLDGIPAAVTAADRLLARLAKMKDKNLNVHTSYTGGVAGQGHAGNNASGTDSWRGGLTWVGELGPEIVDLPKGSKVIPNHEIDAFTKGVGHLAGGIGFVSADWSDIGARMPTSSPSRGDVSALRLREARATTALHTAENALYTLRHKKGHTARQVSAAEDRLSNSRGTLRAPTTALHTAERSRTAAAKPVSTKVHLAATKSNSATLAFLRNIDTLRRQGFVTLADQLVMQADDQAYALAAQAARSPAVRRQLSTDVKASIRRETGLSSRQDAITARLQATADAVAAAAEAAERATIRAATMTTYATTAQLSVRSTTTFYANLRQLASRGFSALASRLLDQSDEEAELVAAQAVGASDAVVSGLNTSVTTATSLAAERQALADSLAGVVTPTAAGTAGMRFFSATPAGAAAASSTGPGVDMSGVRADLAVQTSAIRQLVGGFGGQLDRQARTFQTLARTMPGQR